MHILRFINAYFIIPRFLKNCELLPPNDDESHVHLILDAHYHSSHEDHDSHQIHDDLSNAHLVGSFTQECAAL
jgi:hypothetical protein